MIGCYNYTVILTYIGTTFGLAGIMRVIAGDIKSALICLLFAGLCDMFDGKIASTMKRTKHEKRFGIQIDSLSDLICFGVLPALIGFHCSPKNPICFFVSVAYMLGALIRLAWYNVDEEERQEKEDESRSTFMGLPVTTAALLVPLSIGGLNLLKLNVNMIAPWIFAAIAIAFITPFKLKKAKTVGKIIMILVGLAALPVVLYGLGAAA